MSFQSIHDFLNRNYAIHFLAVEEFKNLLRFTLDEIRFGFSGGIFHADGVNDVVGKMRDFMREYRNRVFQCNLTSIYKYNPELTNV